LSKIIELYSSILRFSGLEPNAEGFISAVVADKKEPAFIDGARMVLPTDNHLRNFVKGEKIIFHPLTENILRGESEVIQKLKTSINVKLNYTIGIVAQSLLKLIASPELHHRLNSEQLEIMRSINDCDEKAVVNFINYMLGGYKTKTDRLFVNIYLKRGGNVGDKRFARVGIVSFPFYEELTQGKVDKLRVKDVETFKQLFKFVFPDIDNKEHYNIGSNSSVAPFLDSLMRTASNIASCLNDVIQQYKEFIDDADSINFDSDWMDDFDNLEDLKSEIRRIPVQQGNEGSIGHENSINRVEIPQATVQTPMPNVPQMAPQLQYQNQTPQQVQQPKPTVKMTDKGINFNSLMSVRPDLAAVPNPIMGNQAMMMPMANQRPDPSWARPTMPQGMMPMQGFQPMQQMPGGFPNQMVQQLMPVAPAVIGSDGNYYYPMNNGTMMPVQMVRQMYPNSGF
jgi:hypothetical protein